MSARDDFMLLFNCDVAEHPEAYKDAVRADPIGHAFKITEGLDNSECLILLRELRRERHLVRKLTAS